VPSRCFYGLTPQCATPVIVVAQRLHEQDLPGHLLRTSDWSLLALPAIATEQERIEVRTDIFTNVGPARFSSPNVNLAKPWSASAARSEACSFRHNQQQPVPAEGNPIRRQSLRCYDVLPAHTSAAPILHSPFNGGKALS
jgi:hypothetical protein